MLRKPKHLEIQQHVGRACRQPQLQPHWSLLLLQPLAVQSITLGLPLGSMCPGPALPSLAFPLTAAGCGKLHA